MTSDSNAWKKTLLNTEAQNELNGLIARADSLCAEPSQANFAEALQHYGDKLHARFLTGLQAYYRHPYARFDYGDAERHSIGAAMLYRLTPPKIGAKPVLLVPSLVNRAYIMHLMPERDFAAYLQKRGLDIWILEWSHIDNRDEHNIAPETIAPETNGFDGYLALAVQAAEHILAVTESKPSLIGYCMGGIFTLALSYLRPQIIDSQVLLAVPWDFSAYDSPYHRGIIEAMRIQFDLLKEHNSVFRVLSPDMVALYFWLINPLAALEKFSEFAMVAPDSERARLFVAVEDWLNDNVYLPIDLAARICREWYLENRTAKGEFTVFGEKLRLNEITAPTQIAIATDDRIVPPRATSALLSALPSAEAIKVPLGHIGMMSSSRAESLLWRRVGDFLFGAG